MLCKYSREIPAVFLTIKIYYYKIASMSEVKTSTIGKDFSLGQLIGFVSAPVITRLLVSFLSTLDDALFVSRYCGQDALAAFSVALPWFMFIDAIGMVFSAVSTVCSIKMGEGKAEEAKRDFTTMAIVAFKVGVLFLLVLLFFKKEILLLLGETEILMPYASSYFTISRFYIPLILVGYVFNSCYVVAGKPKWSMYSSTINIFCQFFFDYLFIVRLNTGIVGAAYANVIGNILVCLLGVIFYANKKHEICFARAHDKVWELCKTVFKYGRMQFVTSLAVSIGSFISNQVLLDIGQEKVVAAHTIVSNATFIFMNSFFGLVGSLSPLVGYAYGEKNAKKLSRICRQSVMLVTILMSILFAIIFFGKNIVLDLYLTETSLPQIRTMALRGFYIYPLALLFFGYNVLVQDFANVLGRHKLSIFLSVMENFIFQNLTVLICPRLFGIDGIWISFPICEVLTFILTCVAVYKNADVYGLGKDKVATFVND